MSRDRELRERLVAHLEGTHALTDPSIAAAFRSVPRHAFVEEFGLDEAYEDRALAIKERDGVVISSISQPSMIAQMLALLDARPAQRILEIGTGSGYNAALLATLAGAGGYVLTVDIEDDLIERARATLALLDMQRVDVAHASTLRIVNSRFDRIIVTARTDDIDERWWDLLADDGRIVVPLDIGYGGERAVGLVREGPYLRSIGSHACAFIEMRTPSDPARSEIFYREGAAHAAAPSSRVPLRIVAARRTEAKPEMLEHAEAVVARPHTIFGISR
ncbi:MAG TPA: methyltransferase domain-containing protein [Candidatus Baltobacteraceae bacterium]|nr:methyltransferase domain-containing protein [Candidatus Baltobacteraceae bacterium]